ncbi:hypothetical protein Pla108_29900 [Botrimarina colliarenosi]|uniref:Uncharacterized protein n=1 Tax=Botrimarina colliarenosi TaxID=2528001 RepID=A0A5C6ACD1_9BACT|nr:hypothetical protein Pla108_29900 [Botrimarina colliarenosi]
MLLHNGSLLEGAVERSPEGVAIQGEGSFLRLRGAEVAYVADSTVGAYEWKRGQAARDGLDATDHLELADWALQNRLLPQAARELLDARQLVPRSGRLDLLERRLDEALRPAAPPAPETKPVLVEGMAEHPGIASNHSVNNPARPILPEGALEQFTRRIQPVLLNSCATAGCHGVHPEPGFALDVAPLRGYGDARSTERNLHATLDLIDLNAVDKSPLLVAAAGPHAGVAPLAGPRRDEMLERLSFWVGAIVAYNRPPEQEAAADQAPPVAEKASVAAEPPVTAESEPDWEAIVAAEADKPTTIQRGVKLTPVRPRDEFDPAVFNTQHRRPQDDE